MQGMYLIVLCENCGEVRVTKATRRFRCFGCGAESTISRENLLADASSASEARQIVAAIKAGRSRADRGP